MLDPPWAYQWIVWVSWTGAQIFRMYHNSYALLQPPLRRLCNRWIYLMYLQASPSPMGFDLFSYWILPQSSLIWHMDMCMYCHNSTHIIAGCYVFTVFLSFFTAKSQAPIQHATYKNSPTPTHTPLSRFSPSLFPILSYHNHTVQRQSCKLALELSREHKQEAGLVPPVPPPDHRPPPRSHPPLLNPTHSTPR